MGNINELLTLKRNALRLGLCGEYKGKWDSAASKRELVNMALDSNGIEFMADSIAFGWGLSKEYLLKEFGEFANGFYQCNEHGYTSEMYIGAHGVIKARSTIILVAYCKDLEIEVPENMVTRIYVCGKSEVRIECKGKCDLIEYGEDNDVKIIGYDDANMTLGTIYVSEWNSCKDERK